MKKDKNSYILLNKRLEKVGLKVNSLVKMLNNNGFIIRKEILQDKLDGKIPLENELIEHILEIISKYDKPRIENTNINAYIDSLIEETGLNNIELATKINSLGIDKPVSANMLSKIRNGHSKAYAGLLLALYEILDKTPNRLKKTKPVKVVSEVSCGMPSSGVYQLEEVVYVESDEYNEYLLAFVANGESMQPEIYSGDTVVVDSSLSPKNGDLVVYNYLGEYACKIIFIEKNIISFIPFNENGIFKTFTVDVNETEIYIYVVKKIIRNISTNNADRLNFIKKKLGK